MQLAIHAIVSSYRSLP